jgi:hypothetical protein
MNFTKMLFSLALVAWLLILSACTSTGQPTNPQQPSPNAEYKQLGVVILGDFFGGPSATAAFIKYDKALPSTFSQDQITPSTSTCTVSRSGETPTTPGPETEPDDDYEGQYLSAGDALTLKSSGTSYTTLNKFSQGEATIYTNYNLPKPLPDNLTLDVPGTPGGFPAFSNVPAGSLADLKLSAPSLPLTTYVTPSTTFSWQKSGASTAAISITASAFDAATSTSVAVICSTKDTGSFSFPETTKAELGSDFKGSSLSLTRISGGLASKGDALLMILSIRSVAGSYRGF